LIAPANSQDLSIISDASATDNNVVTFSNCRGLLVLAALVDGSPRHHSLHL